MNTLRLIVIIVTSYIILSCNAEKSVAVKGNRFKYYDLTSLSGRDSLNATNFSYPNVGIHSSNEKITITHFITAKDSFISTYTKKNGWFERQIIDTVFEKKMLYKEYVRNDSIIVISYNTMSDGSIATIGVYNQGTFLCYCLYDFLKLKELLPDSAITYVKHMKMGRLDKVKFFQKDDQITIMSESAHLEGMPLPTLRSYGDTATGRRIYTTQYSIRNSNTSLDWWLIFKWKYYSSSFFLFEKKLIELGVDPKKIIL
jgi:hypothetical protein